MLCRCQLLSIALLLVAHTKTLEKMDRVLTKLRFLLFSQRCILRNTADLLHFMLYRVLSATSVKIVCCQNGFPHTLGDELTCGSFQLSIWRLTITRIVVQSSSLEFVGINVDRRYHLSVRTWKTIQKSDLGEKVLKLADFELKILQHVRFWIKNFTTRQIFN